MIQTILPLKPLASHAARDMSRVLIDNLTNATLKDVTHDYYYYGCSCQSCLHTARLSMSKCVRSSAMTFPC